MFIVNILKTKLISKLIKLLLALFIPITIFISILAAACLIPLMIFAGESIYIDSTPRYDFVYAAVDLESIVLSSSYPSEDPKEWLTGDVDINSIFASRLAALAKSYNKKIHISSGYRSIEEQWVLWNKRIKEHPNESEKERRRWVAYPGSSMHQFGIAADVEEFAKALTNEQLKPFGLIKPLSNEDWHIEPVEARMTPSDVPQVLPEELSFTEVNKDSLRDYLIKRNSILAEDKYLNAIIEVSREKNVNALLLFAITGQEQSYVPKSVPNAERIANNPFNVYHSWMEYNTNIEDSARIAANTIINLSNGRPATIHPIKWINRNYAEDKNWWIGVSKNFAVLKKVALI